MRKLFVIFILLSPTLLWAQSKSVTRFRADFKENTNAFFYPSTLKMLNPNNDPDLAAIIDGIEEIRVLNYNKAEQRFGASEITTLKKNLQEETYNNLMAINEKGNTINLYGRDKKGKTVGFVAIVENTSSLIVIDLIGTIDIKKFMELKKQLDNKISTNT
ncbi:MAG: DUF4252 domain-containing protein [Prolixibacteraceae bacterium]|nr:DUF4252 domain-containing protein [Prolixibacteraceae bacterium]